MKNKYIVLAISIIIFFSPLLTFAQPLKWCLVGPGGGGAIQQFAFDPIDSNIVYVTSDMVGVFKSINKGETWQWTSKGAFTKLGGIAIDPNNRNVMYALGILGVYMSVNRGKDWWLVYSKGNGYDGIGNWIQPHNLKKSIFLFQQTLPFPISVDKDGLVYVPTNTGDIIRGSDHGRKWEKISTGGKSPVRMVIPIRKGRVLAALFREGIFLSHNHGLKWRNVLSNPKGYTLCVAVHPLNHNLVYALLAKGLYKVNKWYSRYKEVYLYQSQDGGITWKSIHAFSKNEINVGLRKNAAMKEMDVNRKGTIIIYSRPFPIRSTDGGITWEQTKIIPDSKACIYFSILKNGGNFHSIYADPKSDSIWYMATTAVLRSDDDGKTWHYKNEGLRQDYYFFLLVDPSNPDIVFVSDADHGLIKTVDGGKTWKNINVVGPWQEMWGLRFDPRDKTYKTLYGVFRRGDNAFFCKSTDKGEGWKIIKKWKGMGHAIMVTRCLSLVNNHGRLLIYILNKFKGILMSPDEGKTWKYVNKGLPINLKKNLFVVLESDSKGILYVGTTKRGMFKSINRGKSWFPINNGFESLNIRRGSFSIDPNNENVLWVGCGRSVYRSKNGGKNWKKRLSGFYCSATMVEPGNPDNVYVASYQGGGIVSQFTVGIYKSIDGGNYFFRISDCFENTLGASAAVTDIEYGGYPGKIWVTHARGGISYTISPIKGHCLK